VGSVRVVRHDGTMTDELSLPLDDGAVTATLTRATDPVAFVIVAHGAGAGKDHPFLVGFTEALAAEGISSLRFNFPYMDAGRKFPDRAPAAVAVWRAVARAGREFADGLPVWAAGKSFGGRMASMAVAEGMDVAGLVFLGYPLHAPGKPEKLRDEHLYGIDVPMLFVEGTNDPFAERPLLEGVLAKLPTATVDWIEGGGHSFEVKGNKRTPDVIGASLASSVAAVIRP
jgi:predicted alpha/beta-hydrolase family hydrolase